MSVSIRFVVAVAVVSVLVAGIAALTLHDADGLRQAADTTAAGTPPPSSGRVTPAPLDAPVTRVATGAAAPDALSLVSRAPTIVLTAPGDAELPAAQLALRLRVPMALLSHGPSATEAPANDPPANDPPSDSPQATSTPSDSPQPTITPSDDPPATASPSGGAATVTPSALRRLDVQRAIVVGPAALADVAGDAGVGEVVHVDAAPRPAPRARELIRAAARDRGESQLPTAGLDGDAVDRLLADAPPAPPVSGAAVLVRPRDAAALPVVVAARAVGHAIVTTRAHDLRADGRLIDRLAELGDPDRPPPIVLGGPRMSVVDPDLIAAHAATAAGGRQLPGGGQLVIDPRRPHARRYVGLYGTPGSAALGALGEQSVADAVTRAKRLARQYRKVTADRVTVLPCFEIIATVASSSAGRDGNYSNELPVEDLAPAVRAARKAGLYVLLDLQPGRTDFLTQAKRYRRLLRQPHVGLALDPEWRLRPGQRHLRQIGSVGINEVNEVTHWLADLVDRNDLPQKMLLLHQFRLSMVRDRERLDTSRHELAYVVQMDGQGPQGTKLDTWRAITASPPPGVHFGWKNFYDEDSPLRPPADTMAISPPPVFVSYQ